MKHSNSKLNRKFSRKSFITLNDNFNLYDEFFQQHRTLLFKHLCLMVQVNLKRRSGNTCFLLVFLKKKKSTCNLECVIMTSIVLKFRYSLLHHFIHLRHQSSYLYPILIEFPMQSNSVVSSLISALLTCLSLLPKSGLCLSADMKLTSTVLQSDHTDVLPAPHRTYAPADHLSVWLAGSNQRKWPHELAGCI